MWRGCFQIGRQAQQNVAFCLVTCELFKDVRPSMDLFGENGPRAPEA
jgi:hypothetical protein